MMKKSLLLVSGLVIILLLSLQAKSACNEKGLVYYEPFEIDRVFKQPRTLWVDCLD
jgi:hypothetical protein